MMLHEVHEFDGSFLRSKKNRGSSLAHMLLGVGAAKKACFLCLTCGNVQGLYQIIAREPRKHQPAQAPPEQRVQSRGTR